MVHTPKAAAAALALALCLTGCSVLPGAETESLLRAPRLSGQSSAVQKALNSYLDGVATLKYPASGDFLSPFLFGDWDGDGTQEAAVLYTVESGGSNVWLAILEPTDSGGWRVSQQTEGLSSEVESVSYAHLRDAESLQLLVGYDSAQGDRYMVVYLYNGDETLQTVNKQSYTDMLVADVTDGKDGTEDLVLALPTETENGGINLQLLTYTGGDTFLAAQTLAVGEGYYSGCAGLHAGVGQDGASYLVVDGWTASASSLASSIIIYDADSGFLKTYLPPGVPDLYSATQRYDTDLLSMDVDGNGTVDIPTEVADGGTVPEALANQLHFLLWKDYATEEGGNNIFGVYDSEHRFFLRLPESMHGNVSVKSNIGGSGWIICNLAGDIQYCELRVVESSSTNLRSDQYSRVATIGSRQLQARILTEYYGLTLEDILSGVTVLSGTL